MTRTVLFAAVGVLASMAAVTAQDKPQINNPKVVGPVVWNRAITMPGGRTFVTDGGLMLDATLAKPDKMPAVVLPLASGETLSKRVAGPFQDEIALSALRAGTVSNSFVGPRDIPINGNYVTLLRSVAPRSRLRFNGPLDPIAVMQGEQLIGIVMAMAMPKK